MVRGVYDRKIRFRDTGEKVWTGWWDGTYWNGAVNVVVEEAEATRMITAWRGEVPKSEWEDLSLTDAALPPVETKVVGGRERRVRDFSGGYSFEGPYEVPRPYSRRALARE